MWRCVSSLLLVLTMVQTVKSAPTIQSPWATVQGVSMEGDRGRKMNAYLAIPYALPPVADLRFEKPQPHPGLGKGEVFVADQIMPACPQLPAIIGASRKTSEDCLMLDVYTPVGADGNTSPRAVMFFIHGGGFTMGDAHSYRPSRLVVDGDVVVVIIQYRLGVFGYVSTGDNVLPGNAGIWDQNLALQWVKNNIRAFGGDPNEVTIFGESAGGGSVGLLLLSPASRGLFKRAILQSGVPQGLFRLTKDMDMKDVFKGLADAFECQGDTSLEWLQCLKQQPEDVYFNKSSAYSANTPLGSCFFPIVDGELIPKDTEEILQDHERENGAGNVDVMVGFNNKEGALVIYMTAHMQVTEDYLYSSDFFRTMADYCIILKGLKNNPVVKKAIEFFYRGAETSLNKSESLEPVVSMYGDCLLTADIVEFMQYLAASPHTATRYLYVMDHDFADNDNTLITGAYHGDELMMQFDNSVFLPEDSVWRTTYNKTGITAEELPLADQFVQIFTTFAKTGNPSGPVQEDLGGEWPEFTMEEEAYLSISSSPRVVTKVGPYRDRVALWNTHLPQISELTANLPAQETNKEESVPKDEL